MTIDRVRQFDPKQKKARKEHVCDGCDQPIEPGQIYIATPVLEGDHVVTYRTHAECELNIPTVRIPPW